MALIHMSTDAHQHFWRFSEADYPWIGPESPLRRNYLPSDLAPELAACDLRGCIAVQARQTLEESRWLLELAHTSPIIQGVVGWVDLQSLHVEQQLAEFSQDPKFVGVRHVIQDEEDEMFMARPSFLRGIRKLESFGLTYDLLIYPHHLPGAIELARAFPGQRFVLDHLAKPRLREGLLHPWREHLQELAACPNVMCKVSGLVTEADWSRWTPADLRPYLDAALEAFGEERLMFGSDWPVALLAGSYARVFQVVYDFVQERCPNASAKIFGGNARRFYNLPS